MALATEKGETDLAGQARAKLAEIDPTGLSEKLKAAIDIDVEGAIRILEEDSQRFNQGLDQASPHDTSIGDQ